MTQEIEPREVLGYLNELGYTNITAQQLKEFIMDLKKLLKFDSRYGSIEKKTYKYSRFDQSECEYCECESHSEAEELLGNQIIDKENCNKIENTNSKPNSENKHNKDQHIAVHIFNNKKPNIMPHDHCIHVEKLNFSNLVSADHNLQSNTAPDKNINTETMAPTVRSTKPSSTRECESRTSSQFKKSKVAFIRPATARPSVNKSDPVALYHYYQSEWNKTKIPGQDNRNDLRWAIRERMLSGPRVEIKSKCNVQRCGWR